MQLAQTAVAHARTIIHIVTAIYAATVALVANVKGSYRVMNPKYRYFELSSNSCVFFKFLSAFSLISAAGA